MLMATVLMFGGRALAATACDATAGQSVFDAKCAICHSITAAGGAIVGPPLFNVVGRRPASIPGFAYSEPMRARKDTWTVAVLDWFLSDPPNRVPGTYMAFLGIKRDSARADLICYLQTAHE